MTKNFINDDITSEQVQGESSDLHDINQKQEKRIHKEINAEQVQKKLDELNGINQKQEERIHKLEAKALQLTNLYFVFQGVILSSISKDSPIKCHKWYVPFILSLIATLFNFVSLSSTLFKYLRYKEELDQNKEDISMMKQHLTRAQVKGLEPIEDTDERATTMKRQKPDLYKQRKRQIFCYAGIVFFLVFGGIILYGCHSLLCDLA